MPRIRVPIDVEVSEETAEHVRLGADLVNVARKIAHTPEVRDVAARVAEALARRRRAPVSSGGGGRGGGG